MGNTPRTPDGGFGPTAQAIRDSLEAALAANANERVTWSGPHRQRPLTDALIVPRPRSGLARHWWEPVVAKHLISSTHNQPGEPS